MTAKLLLLFTFLVSIFCAPASADSPSSAVQEGKAGIEVGEKGEDQTPLAGEPAQTTFLGRKLTLPPRDRSKENSISLGGVLYSPNQGDTSLLPIGSLFVKRIWNDARLRLVVSGFVNDIQAATGRGNFELVGNFENFTIPFDENGVQDNREVRASRLQWGTLSAYLGPGLRFRVPPYKIDNEARMQLLGRVGYLYSRPSHDTPRGVRLPPETMLYGGLLRGAYDGIRRNLLELPHEGNAAGIDLDYVHRDVGRILGIKPLLLRKRTPRIM